LLRQIIADMQEWRLARDVGYEAAERDRYDRMMAGLAEYRAILAHMYNR
jgi:hypothetical protein